MECWHRHRRSGGEPRRSHSGGHARDAEAPADPGGWAGLAPPHTQLLLLSGSVENPQDVVKWLLRLGRKAVLVRSLERPVPQEEVFANTLSYHLPPEIRTYWPRLVARALADSLGPILLF